MRLAVRRWPDRLDPATPTTLLVHGVTASSRTWWRIGPAVAAAGWQVLAVDLRCHGASGCADLTGARDLAWDVAETLEAELGSFAVDVAWGHSLGARTIMQLLNEVPDAARRLVLEDPPGNITPRRSASIDGWRREVDQARSDPAASAAEQRRLFSWDPRDVAENVTSLAECRIEAIIGAFDLGAREVAPDLAPGIAVPALLVVADAARGTALPEPDRARTIAALPAGSRMVELPGGHTLHRDVPGAYLETILEWLGEPRRAPAA